MRRFMQCLTTAIAALVAASFPGAAGAASASTPFIRVGSVTDAPDGFVKMCLRDRVICAAGLPMPRKQVELELPPIGTPLSASFRLASLSSIVNTSFAPASSFTNETWHSLPRLFPSAPEPDAKTMRRLVRAINRNINQTVAQVSDEITSGQKEYWELPRRWYFQRIAGDCEDIAIAKRMELIRAGFPANRLNYAVVYRRDIGLHVVLLAHLDQGDYVLDSAVGTIRLWNKTNYVWLRIQSRENPLQWHVPETLGNAHGGTTIATADSSPRA
jgi:predicted transglutaminase-like cysteine proteinase